MTLDVFIAEGRLAASRIFPARQTGAEALVFLHEALGSISLWRGFPEALCAATGREGLVYERFGSGGSDPIPGPRGTTYLHEEAHRLREVLAATGIRSPILVGHSDGGTIALLFAAACPDSVAAAVTLAAHVLIEPETVLAVREVAERWRTTDLPIRLGRHHGAGTEALFHAWADTWTSPEFASWNVEEELGSVTAPLLVLQGENDAYGTERQVEAIARGVKGPVETRLLKGCGHSPHLEKPDEVAELVADFLSRHPGSSREGAGRT